MKSNMSLTKKSEPEFKTPHHERVSIDFEKLIENFSYYASKQQDTTKPIMGLETAQFFEWYEGLGKFKIFWYIVVLRIKTLGELRDYWKEHINK